MDQAYEGGNEDMKPTIYIYNTLISALAKSGDKLEQAEELLRIMKRKAKRGQVDLTPTVVTYSSVMNVLANSPARKAPVRAEKLLEQMHSEYLQTRNASIKPDTVAYSSALQCWANSRAHNAAVRAQRLLSEMETRFIAGDKSVRPNEQCYGAVIHCWAKNASPDAAVRAEKILAKMEQMHEKGINNVSPNTICCNALLDCYAKSVYEDKAQRALGLIRRMNEQYLMGNKSVKSDIISYNCLLNSCANTITEDETIKREAITIAVNALQQLVRSKDYFPTSYSFASFLKACSTLMPLGNERVELVKTAFRVCCDEGQVDRQVLLELELALPEQLYIPLLRGYVVDGKAQMEAIPDGWKRNVDKRRKL